MALGADPFDRQVTPWEGAVLLDPAFVAGGGVAYLRTVDIVGASIRVRLAATADGEPTTAGPEFTDTFELADAALTFADADGASVTLRGPGAAGNTFLDAEEPCFWTPDNSEAWRGWVLAPPNGAVTLTLDDGVAATEFAGIARADIRAPGDLTAVLGLDALDTTGLVVDAAALLVASGAPTLYADADRGGSDSPLAGELGLGGGETVISRIQRLGGSRIRLNDNDNPAPLTLETYFLQTGRRIIVQTLAGGRASFVAADHTSEADAGGGYVNFGNLPADVVSVLDGIVAGTRFIFAVGRESPELAGIARAAVRVRGDVGLSVRLAGVARAAMRTRGVVGAVARLAGVVRASTRTSGKLASSAPLTGIVRAAIATRGALGFSSRLAGITRGAIRARGILRVELPVGAYFTADEDVLDEICWRRYGREDAVPAVLAANPRLADAGPVLPAGVLIVLPDLPRASWALPAERLWEVAPPSVVLPERERRDVRLGGSFRAAMRALA